MKERVRGITARNGGRSMRTRFAELRSYLAGWKEYFRLAETRRVFSDMDEWIAIDCGWCSSSSGNEGPPSTGR